MSNHVATFETIIKSLDTGSPHLFVDYDQLLEADAVDFRPNAEAFIQQHLGEYYRFHIVKIKELKCKLE